MIIRYLKYKTFPQLLLMYVCVHVCMFVYVYYIFFLASSSENHLNAEY